MFQIRSVLPALRDVLRQFSPAPSTVDWAERLRASCGALIGILLTGLVTRLAIGSGMAVPMLIAPMGASAVLLFAVPASPLAQPWSILGGNITAALIGVTCALLVTDPLWAAALSIAGAIAAMVTLRCVHPPSGAVALTAVLGGPQIHALGFGYVLMPVGVNSLLLLTCALIFNNATRRRYPHLPQHAHTNPHATKDPLPTERLGFTPADLDAVLQRYNQVIDIGRDDLETLFLQTEMQAYRRHFGIVRCRDIMSRDIVSVLPETPLSEAWDLLQLHDIKALPVLDSQRRVLGIVSAHDIVQGHGASARTLEQASAALRAVQEGSDTTTVRSVMSAPARTATLEQPLVELVPLLSDTGFHHIPIVDDQQHLAGMVSQSDLLAALYRARLEEAARPPVQAVAS
jgi:CBS domain-containing membrane protein